MHFVRSSELYPEAVWRSAEVVSNAILMSEKKKKKNCVKVFRRKSHNLTIRENNCQH